MAKKIKLLEPVGINNFTGEHFTCFTKGDSLTFTFEFDPDVDVSGWSVVVIFSADLTNGGCGNPANTAPSVHVSIPLYDAEQSIFKGVVSDADTSLIPAGIVYASAKRTDETGITKIIDMCKLEVYPNLAESVSSSQNNPPCVKANPTPVMLAANVVVDSNGYSRALTPGDTDAQSAFNTLNEVVETALEGLDSLMVYDAAKYQAVTLESGQTVVPLTYSVEASSFVVAGDNCDSYRLLPDIDYDLNLTNNTVELKQSYPEGTTFVAIFNHIDRVSLGFDPGISNSENLAMLKLAEPGLASTMYLRGRDVAGDSGRGLFLWNSGDLSSKVAGEPDSYFYVAPSSDTTGASGAWVRQPTTPNPATLDQLREIIPYEGEVATLTEEGRDGTFVWKSENLSTEVASDPQSGIYVAPSSDLTGASGAWVRQYEGAANVKWFGAVGDGVTDDSASFQASFNLCREIEIPATPMYYKVKNLTLPNGHNIRGIGRRKVYAPSSASDMEGTCCLVYDTTGSSFIAFQGSNSIQDINFYGVDHSIPMVDALSGSRISFLRVSSCGFLEGFGNSAYLREAWLYHCNASKNHIGLRNLIDSHVACCEFNANEGHGIQQGAGADDTQFVDCKVEWNVGSGYEFYQASSCSILGGICDRNYTYGLVAKACAINVSGGVFCRNGRTNAAGSHFYCEGAKLYLSNVLTQHGVDDDGTGTDSPQYTLSVGGTVANTSVNLSNCDMSGCVTEPLHNTFGAIIASATNTGCVNVPKYLVENNSFTNTVGETFTVSATGLPYVAPYSYTMTYKVIVKIRDASIGTRAFAEFAIMLSREGGSVSCSAKYKILGGPEIELSGGSKFDIDITNIDVDGRSFDVVATSTTNNSMRIYMYVL